MSSDISMPLALPQPTIMEVEEVGSLSRADAIGYLDRLYQSVHKIDDTLQLDSFVEVQMKKLAKDGYAEAKKYYAQSSMPQGQA